MLASLHCNVSFDHTYTVFTFMQKKCSSFFFLLVPTIFYEMLKFSCLFKFSVFCLLILGTNESTSCPKVIFIKLNWNSLMYSEFCWEGCPEQGRVFFLYRRKLIISHFEIFIAYILAKISKKYQISQLFFFIVDQIFNVKKKNLCETFLTPWKHYLQFFLITAYISNHIKSYYLAHLKYKSWIQKSKLLTQREE